jgi:hypothetical protein
VRRRRDERVLREIVMSRRSVERLTPLDASYLARETDAQPLHFVLQLDLPGRLTREQVRDHLADRIARLPYMHRKPLYPFVVKRPFWVDDRSFDLDRHIAEWELPITDEGDLRAAYHRLVMQRLPQDQPLWRLVVATGPGERTTLWLCLHHAMMDGGLARQMLADLFGQQPAGTAESAGSPWHARRHPPRAILALAVVLHGMKMAVRRRLAPTPQPKREPLRPTHLTGQVSPRRALADVTLSLEEVRAASRAHGLTINDFMLCALTDALRRYLPAPPDEVLCLVPRDVRREEEEGRIGNRGITMLLALPTGTADAAERERLIRGASERAKQTTETSGAQGYRFDVSLSNVRLGGPHAVAGFETTGLRIGVPLQGQSRLAVVVTSRVDEFTISITADGDAFGDVESLALHMRDAVNATLAEVRAGVGGTR